MTKRALKPINVTLHPSEEMTRRMDAADALLGETIYRLEQEEGPYCGHPSLEAFLEAKRARWAEEDAKAADCC